MANLFLLSFATLLVMVAALPARNIYSPYSSYSPAARSALYRTHRLSRAYVLPYSRKAYLDDVESPIEISLGNNAVYKRYNADPYESDIAPSYLTSGYSRSGYGLRPITSTLGHANIADLYLDDLESEYAG